MANVASNLIASATQQKNKFVQDVIGSGYVIQSTVTGRNLLYYVIDKGSKNTFYNNAIRLVLCGGRKKFRTITTNYCTIIPKLHGTTGKFNNDINEDTSRDEIESLIKLIADKQGESHTTRFLR